MPCFHPLAAWEFQGLAKLLRSDRPVPVEFPCGRCLGCHQVRQRSWALRIVHEAQVNRPSCFITLTYEEPCAPSLNPSDFKAFMRRLVAAHGPTRYFVAGEYGSLTGRPHFHAVLFGRDFARSFPVHGCGDETVFASRDLARLWPAGFSSVTGVTFKSARYVAKYTLKSVRSQRRMAWDPDTGELLELHPEYARMSRRPGLGSAWFARYWEDVYAARDGVCLPGGTVVPPPRFYDRLLEGLRPDLRDAKRLSRVAVAYSRRADSTPGRLLVRETCARAAIAHKRGVL